MSHFQSASRSPCKSGRARGAFPQPFPIHVEPGTAHVSSFDVFDIGNVPYPGGLVAGIILPGLGLGMAVGERKNIAAATVVICGYVWIEWIPQVALQIAVIHCVHRLITKNPGVGLANTVEITHLGKQTPSENHIGH